MSLHATGMTSTRLTRYKTGWFELYSLSRMARVHSRCYHFHRNNRQQMFHPMLCLLLSALRHKPLMHRIMQFALDSPQGQLKKPTYLSHYQRVAGFQWGMFAVRYDHTGLELEQSSQCMTIRPQQCMLISANIQHYFGDFKTEIC